MSSGCRRLLIALAALAFGCAVGPARADVTFAPGTFSPNGDVGFGNSSGSIAFGDGNASILQLDGFVNIPGQSGNGFDPGSSYQLSNNQPGNAPLPAGLSYTFGTPVLSGPHHDELTLTYTFTNNTGATLQGFQFLVYADAEITNGNSNQFATILGASGPSKTFQADDPQGSIFTNLSAGALDNANHKPAPATPGDVALALGFGVSDLSNGATRTFNVLLSDDGLSLAGVSLTAHGQGSPDSLTLSGATAVPEPSPLLLGGLALLIGVSARSARPLLAHYRAAPTLRLP